MVLLYLGSQKNCALNCCKPVGAGVTEVPRQYHHILTYQLTLSQPGGTNYSQHITTAPPHGFLDVPTVLCCEVELRFRLVET